MLQGLAPLADTLSNPGYEWIEMKSDKLPENAYPAGKDQGENVWVGRAGKNIIYSTGKDHNKVRYYENNGKEVRVSSEPFHVLCVDPSTKVKWCHWTYQEEDPQFPSNAVIGGTLANGSKLCVGRGMINNQLTPGLVYRHTLVAVYGGEAHYLTNFDILVVETEEEGAGAEIKKQVAELGQSLDLESVAKDTVKNQKEVLRILNEVEAIEAEIESEEEKYNSIMEQMKEKHRSEMDNRKNKLNEMRKELKNVINSI